MTSDKSPLVAAPKGFTWGNLITVIVTLVSVSTAYGAANARMDEAFSRIERMESELNPTLQQLQSDINDIKIQVAITAGDIEWIKKNTNEESR